MEQSNTAICPECGAEMPITAEHNGIAWVGHGICAKCGLASQHALPDDFKLFSHPTPTLTVSELRAIRSGVMLEL
jgi:predicted amidophosphoribosyltransferase